MARGITLTKFAENDTCTSRLVVEHLNQVSLKSVERMKEELKRQTKWDKIME